MAEEELLAKPRSGPWSKEEKQYIAENAESMAYEDIARRLRRNPDKVKTYIQESLGKKIVGSEFAVNPEYDIQRSPIWRTLKTQFSEEELKLFLYHWSRIISQFKDDVFPTEELQIIDTIKIEILINRTLKEQRTAVQAIEELEKEMARLQAENKDGEDIDAMKEISNLDRQIAFHRTSLNELSVNYNNLLAKKSAGLKELKATRGERVKNIENSRQSMIGWISELMRNKALRRQLGLNMEKMRIAIDVEEARLMQPHTYIDNNIDYPILNSTLMDKLKKESTNEQEKGTDTGS